jgi:hypothetical protein
LTIPAQGLERCPLHDFDHDERLVVAEELASNVVKLEGQDLVGG